MKRERFYRGKRVDGNGWVEGDLVHKYIHHKSGVSIVNGGGCVWHEVIPETAGQYIGLADVNENEIFEGDIVRAEDHYGFEDIVLKGVVEFKNGSFGVRVNKTFYKWNNYSAEILGNIHDKPELLEKFTEVA